MKKNWRFWALAFFVCTVGALNGSYIGGVSRLRGALVGLVGGVFLIAAYISTRSTFSYRNRLVINGCAGLICGCLCAELLGKSVTAVIGWGVLGMFLGFGSGAWLPYIQ